MFRQKRLATISGLGLHLWLSWLAISGGISTPSEPAFPVGKPSIPNPVGPGLDRTGWAPFLPIHDVFQLPNTVLGQVEVKGRGHGLDGDADWWVTWEILLIDSITS
jgi:hypothetical protein